MTPAGLRCRWLGHGDLPGLVPAWQDLCERCPWTTPFQRPDWLIPWTRHLGPDEPWLFTAWAGRRLVGLVPLFRYQTDERRILALLGAGLSDYLDALIEPGWEGVVLDTLLARLDARKAAWDVCELEEQRPTSPLLRARLPRGWSASITTQSACPVLDLPARVQDLGLSVPGRHLQRFHQARRRAAKHGALRLCGARGHHETRLDALFGLHAGRWRARGEPGMLAQPDVRALHTEAAAAFAARGALALYRLELGGALIASLYGFFERDTLYFYLSGFAPEHARLSPGTLIIGLVIEDAIARGLRRFDFLRGSEPYKRWWGARDQATMRVRLRAGTSPARRRS